MLRDMDYKRLEVMARPGDISREAVGLRLAAGLRVANLKQTELARAVGKTQGAIGNAVAGSNYPNVEVLQALYRITQVDFNFFLAGHTSQLSVDVQTRLLFALEAVHSERDQRSCSD
jgi:transcriptional regulator with XRE-family HTH domain